MSLFSKTEKHSSAEKLYELISQRLMRRVAILIEAESIEILQKSMSQIGPDICKLNWVRQCRWNIDSKESKEFFSFYSKNQELFLPPEIIQEIKDNNLVSHQINSLFSPLGMAAASMLATDPFGVQIKIFSRLNLSSSLLPQNNIMVGSYNGHLYSLITFSVEKQTSLNSDRVALLIENLRWKLQQGSDGVHVYAASGLLYLKKGADQGTQEASLFAVISMGLVIFLLFLTFQRMSYVVAAFSTIVMGSVIGFIFCYFIFGEIHVITLLLGFSLIGVVADYSIHFFGHHSDQYTVGKIKIPLLLSLITTIVGYACFYFSNVPVLQQLSLFAVLGLLVSAAIVFLFYPILPVKKANAQGCAISRIFVLVSTTRDKMVSKIFSKSWVQVMSISLGIISAAFVKRVDDVRLYQTPSKELVEQQNLIQKIVGIPFSGKYLFVSADSVESMLRKEEEIFAEFGSKGFMQGISQWIPSQKYQEISMNAYTKLNESSYDLFRKIGVKENLGSKKIFYQSEKMQKIDFDTWLKKFINYPISDQFLGQINGQYHSAVSIGDLLFDKISVLPPGVQKINRSQVLSDFFSQIREKTIFLLGVLFFVCLLGFSFIWSFKNSIALLFAPAMGVLVSAFFTSKIFGHLNLFSTMGLLLVFFLSVDYSFFSKLRHSQISNEVDVAIGVSVLTTLFSFGVLAFSKLPAVQHFGLSVCFGILTSYVFTFRGLEKND